MYVCVYWYRFLTETVTSISEESENKPLISLPFISKKFNLTHLDKDTLLFSKSILASTLTNLSIKDLGPEIVTLSFERCSESITVFSANCPTEYTWIFSLLLIFSSIFKLNEEGVIE